MKIYTRAEAIAKITEALVAGSADVQYDNQGQVIVYSCIFLWKDGSYRDEEDPSYDEG